MTVQQDVLNAGQGMLWLQRTPGKVPEVIGCVDLDDIAEPQGDVTLSVCRAARRKFQTVGRSQGAPGAVTTSFTAWVGKAKTILDEIREAKCPIFLYALSLDCGNLNVFDFVRARIVRNAVITNIGHINLVKRLETGEQAVKIDLSGDPPLGETRVLKATRQSIAETTNLNDIAFCDDAQCAGTCGAQSDAGEVGFTGGDAPAGSPTTKADIWQTDDAGAAWLNTLGGAAHPFAVAEDIMSVTCFDLNASDKRWLVARASAAGKAAEVAYSDDSGATWTLVTVGAVLTEGANHGGALFSLDMYHVWFATDQGNVYFSEDGGATWTLQDSATASGGNVLNAIHFSGDGDHGYAVGETGAIIESTDGGESWSAITPPVGTAAVHFYAVHTFDQRRVIVGNGAGGVWQTWDEGINWTQETYPGYAATSMVRDMRFINESTGFMIVDTQALLGEAYRSIDGGYNWKALSVPTNAGLNAISVVTENLAYVCGNIYAGTSFIAKVTG